MRFEELIDLLKTAQSAEAIDAKREEIAEWIPVSLQEFQNLMLLQVADALAHVQVPIVEKRVEICTELAGAYGVELYERIMNGE